ncbi:MAG: HEAT repeat domain-containing protein [bacterium]
MIDSKGKEIQKEVPLDTMLLADTIIELNIARKNILIYPHEHIRIKTSTERAYAILIKIFELRSDITLGIAKDSLLVGNGYLDKKNPVFKEFANALSQHSIAGVTFLKDINQEELFQFLSLLTKTRDDLESEGSIEKAIGDKNFTHIKIKFVNYNKFHLTEEENISRQKEKTTTNAEIWEDFVSNLLANSLTTSEAGVPIAKTKQIAPHELAHFISNYNIDTNAAIKSYENIITSHLHESSMKEQMVQGQSPVLEKLNVLIQELNPELKKQFLSTTFKQCSELVDSRQAEAFLSNFSHDIVIEMLLEANKKKEKISPSLMALVQKLSHTQEETYRSLNDHKPQSCDVEETLFPSEELQNLFQHEQYNEYIISEYGSMLDYLSKQPGNEIHKDLNTFPIDEYIKTLDDSFLDTRVARVLITFMNDDTIEVNEYNQYAEKLVSLLDALLEMGDFSFLLEIIKTFTQHSTKNPHADIRLSAKKFLERLNDPLFISKAVNTVNRWANDKYEEAYDFMLSLGPPVVPDLLNLYATKENPDEEDIIYKILCDFEQDTVNVAKNMLNNSNVHSVRNILALLQKIGDSELTPYLMPLCKHWNQDIRMDVLAILLIFKDPWGIRQLRNALYSKNPDEVNRAIFQAGKYRVSDVVPDLVSMIKRLILSQNAYSKNETIIKALGHIGDSRAIPVLEKLARTFFTLYPTYHSTMKVVLFKSLKQYPYHEITKLLTIGEQSKNEKIQKVCNRLRAKKQNRQEETVKL